MSYEDRRRAFVRKNIILDNADREGYYKRKMANKVESEDIKSRREIHEFIRQQSTVVKSRQELLDKLKEKFSDEKYEKYHQYFNGWVNHAVREDEGR